MPSRCSTTSVVTPNRSRRFARDSRSSRARPCCDMRSTRCRYCPSVVDVAHGAEEHRVAPYECVATSRRSAPRHRSDASTRRSASAARYRRNDCDLIAAAECLFALAYPRSPRRAGEAGVDRRRASTNVSERRRERSSPAKHRARSPISRARRRKKRRARLLRSSSRKNIPRSASRARRQTARRHAASSRCERRTIEVLRLRITSRQSS